MHLARIVASAILIVPYAALAQYMPPYAPQTAEEKTFYSAVAKSIFAVMPGERGKFGLTLAERQPPTFYGREPNTIEALPCERIASFGMLGYATELGHIGAAVCANGAKARELSLRAKAHFAAIVKQFGGEAEMRRAGWSFSQETLADGAEYFYFPVIIIGHGVVGPVTGVLHDGKSGKALVVQAEVRQMCGEQFTQEFKGAPFCTDLAGSVKRIVLGLRSVL